MNLSEKLTYNVVNKSDFSILDNDIAVIRPRTMKWADISPTWDILAKAGIKIPAHSVIIFPNDSRANEVPFSYIDANMIMLFPVENKAKLLFQYLHEIGHLIVGNFEQKDNWVGEILACSFNFFLFPNEFDNRYFQWIHSNVLTIQENQANYKMIEQKLYNNPTLVYNGAYNIQSILFSYKLKYPEFNFVNYLKSFISCQNDSAKRAKLVENLKLFLKGESSFI